MAKRKVNFTLGSEREAKIEKAYKNTASGKTIYAVSIVAFMAFLCGFLITLYEKMAVVYQIEINTADPIYPFSEHLITWGGFVALVCLLFYIKFANGYKEKKVQVNKPSPKKVVKKKK